MPIYLYWGEDDFAIAKTIAKLQTELLDPNWFQFNYHQFSGELTDNTISALNEAMTPAFGIGQKLVLLANSTIMQQCSQDLLTELERTLPVIPENCYLLFTTTKKPDGRLKSTKLVQKYGEVKEFSLIPYWDTKKLNQKVKQLATDIDIKLTTSAIELLVESVGNNTRLLWNELEKLSVHYHNSNSIIERDLVATLVPCNTQNSLQLAAAIRDGKIDLALNLINDLLNHNEPPLRIVASLVKQFRTWAIIKSAIEGGEKDHNAIAKLAEIPNPYRIKYLIQEVKSVNSEKLIGILPLLLDLEYGLKRGVDSLSIMQTQAIKMCSLTSQSQNKSLHF